MRAKPVYLKEWLPCWVELHEQKVERIKKARSERAFLVW
jgi:hypothetical protein